MKWYQVRYELLNSKSGRTESGGNTLVQARNKREALRKGKVVFGRVPAAARWMVKEVEGD